MFIPSRSRETRPVVGLLPGLLVAAVAFMAVSPAQSIRADSWTSNASTLKPEEAEKRISGVLDKLDKGGYYSDPKTLGFRFLYRNRFLSSFSYDIYGVAISSTIPTTVIRIEGNSGDAHALTRILELENILEVTEHRPKDVKPRALTRKNHLFSQGLNLAAPWLSVLYSSWDSPRLTTGQTWFRFLAYFLWDALAVYTAGSNGFRHRYKAGLNTGPMAAALVASRLLGAWQHFHLSYGHNRLVELKYTFYLNR